MSITLIQASWSRQLNPSDDTPFNRLFTDSAHQQELMVVRLGDPDIHSSAPVENVAWPGRLVTDGTAIRLILSDHDVMQLPAVVVRAEDGSTAVHYLPQLPEGKTIEATDGPSVMRGPEGEAVSDCLFRQAMDAYNAFDINTSARLFSEVIELDPRRESAYFNLAGIMHMCGYPTLALHLIEQFLMLNPVDSTAKAFLWSLASSEEGRRAALGVYRRLAAVGGETLSTHRLAQLTGEICLEADNTYLKDFYDEIASHFESKLVLHLGYRGPWVLYDMVSKVLEAELSISSGEPSRLSPIGQFRIFDLGCGSGLCGRVFGHLCKAGVEWTSVACPNITIEDTMKALEANAADQALSAVSSERFVPLSLFESAIPSTGALLAGIDISANMIDVSSNPVNNYTLLTCGHLVDGLRAFCGDKDKLDLIIAADTFIYVGALEKVFKLISEALKSGGLLTFSTELLAPEIDGSHPPLAIDETYLEGELVSNSIIQHGFRLLESARFGHSVKYIQSLCKAHGLKIISAESRVLRTESSVPLPGMFYVIQKKIAMPNCS